LWKQSMWPRSEGGCFDVSQSPIRDHFVEYCINPGTRCRFLPGAKERAAKQGNLSLRLGLGWAKSHALHTGQTPVLKYNRQLMQAILWDRLPIAKIVNVKVIGLEQASEGYKSFDAGVASKFVIDPHGQLSKAAWDKGGLGASLIEGLWGHRNRCCRTPRADGSGRGAWRADVTPL
jgi:hypothetical protein